MTGRARGRGVARGRGAPPSAGPDAARRPGSAAPPPAAAPAQAAAPSNGNGNGNGAGRASHRGGARGEPRPGAPVDVPTTQFAQMSMGTGDAPDARQGRERRTISYHEPHTRPDSCADKKGTSGQPCNLFANYFPIESSPGWQLYQYHVDFNPPIDSKKLRKGLVWEHAQKLFQAHLFDGMMLFSNTKLPDEVTEFISVRKYDEEKIRITIKRTAELSPNNPQCIQIFNIMFRQILSDLELKEVQRAYFDPHSAVTLPRHKMEIWPGYKTAIAQYDGSVMLNVDLMHKVLRTETVLDAMYALYNNNRGPNFKDECVRKLVGEIVMTRYNDKTYRIDDIAWDIHPPMTFKRKDEEISYKSYYKTIYNIDVRDDNQPMLVSRPKKKDQREGAPELLYLLPELCNMTGLTDDQRANFGLMKDMGVHTRVDPTKKGNEVMGLRRRMDGNEKVVERLKGWGVKFSDNLVKLQGRTLPQETIIMGPDGRSNQAKTMPAGRDADWGRDLTRGRQLQTVPLKNWILVYAPVTNQDVLGNFLQTLRKVCGPMGIDLSPPTKVALNNNSTSAFLEGIRSHVNPQLQMVVCILPSNKKDLYDAIKKQCCVETPVPSQCITNKLISNPKGIMSPVSKIAIQLNCKLGGESWSVEVPLKKCMVVGIDTYHDSAKKGRSVGGFVASLNGSFTRYYSQTIFQSSMQELIDGLKVCMAAALKKWHAINNGLPERIMVYRDGVGDGQLAAVFEHECSQIMEAAMGIGSSYNPKLTVIVVKKRISSRFFAPAQNNLANPGPGTVIDTMCTRPEWYDFFVVSQSVRQGTVTPTHYNVVYDTSGLRPDHIQRLTYKLCHLYYNWPGTIRVPAPCQYAHKLAFLTGQSIHKTPDLNLADKLFYL